MDGKTERKASNEKSKTIMEFRFCFRSKKFFFFFSLFVGLVVCSLVHTFAPFPWHFDLNFMPKFAISLELTRSHIVGSFNLLVFFFLFFFFCWCCCFVFTSISICLVCVCVLLSGLFILLLSLCRYGIFGSYFFRASNYIHSILNCWNGYCSTGSAYNIAFDIQWYVCNPLYKTCFPKCPISSAYPLSQLQLLLQNMLWIPWTSETEWTTRGADICSISIKLHEL